jgi:phosphohistidine phosphatase
MKTLVIIRHAKAEEAVSSLNDFDRPLKKIGKKTAKLMAEKLLSMGVIPDLIISSPATRALHTAEIIAEEFSLKNIVLTKGFIYKRLYNLMDLIEEIISESKDSNTVFVVGHYPTIMLVIKQIQGVELQYLETSSALVYDFECDNWMDLLLVNRRLRIQIDHG